MAALTRTVTATCAVDETIRVDTNDNEDHTFCGIMFPIRAKNILPIEKIIIQSVAVRGQLGNISIWVSKAVSKKANKHSSNSSSTSSRTSSNNNSSIIADRNANTSSFRLSPDCWTKVYEEVHKPSRRVYKQMDLTTSSLATEPVVLLPGEIRLLYIHSTLESDAAIVYDNTQTNPFGGPINASSVRYEDDKIAIHTGKAHLSFIPFGQESIWGWGDAWRDRREFVGQIQYGTVYKLWHPDRHNLFGRKFHKGAESLLLLQRRNTLFSRLPDECIYYILHMCHWDWFGDTSHEINVRNRNRKRIQREEETRQRVGAQLVQQLHTLVPVENVATTTCSKKYCHKNLNMNDRMQIDDNEHNYDDDEDFVDAKMDGDNRGDSEDDDDDDDDDEDDEQSSVWERAYGYRADTSRFIFYHASSDDEDDNRDNDDNVDKNNNNVRGRPCFGRRVVRQLIVNVLGGRRRKNLSR